MKYRIFAVLVLSVLVLNLGGSTFADSKARRTSMTQLIALLPASDGVVIFDAKRFFVEAMPKFGSSGQVILAKLTGKIDGFQTETGIDIRKFDDVGVGVSTRQIAEKKFDVDPVVIGRGRLTSASLIGAAKVASKSKYREERVGDRVMYVFDAQNVVAPTAAGVAVLDKVNEVALASLDAKTVAFGDVGRVRQTLEGKTKVGADLVGMLERSPASVAAFAARPPAGLKAFIPLDNDELGKNIDSIQYVYGNANVIADAATIHVVARTYQNAQATSLFETLEGLQLLGKAFLGAAKGADKQVYSRMIDNAKFSVRANEVTFDLSVPQADIDVLVGLIK